MKYLILVPLLCASTLAWAGKPVIRGGDTPIEPTPQRPSVETFGTRVDLNKPYEIVVPQTLVPAIVDAASTGPF
jgi:hypothetical protein